MVGVHIAGHSRGALSLGKLNLVKGQEQICLTLLQKGTLSLRRQT